MAHFAADKTRALTIVNICGVAISARDQSAVKWANEQNFLNLIDILKFVLKKKPINNAFQCTLAILANKYPLILLKIKLLIIFPKYRTRAIISNCLKISMARKFSKMSMPKTLKPYFLDTIVDT